MSQPAKVGPSISRYTNIVGSLLIASKQQPLIDTMSHIGVDARRITVMDFILGGIQTKKLQLKGPFFLMEMHNKRKFITSNKSLLIYF